MAGVAGVATLEAAGRVGLGAGAVMAGVGSEEDMAAGELGWPAVRQAMVVAEAWVEAGAEGEAVVAQAAGLGEEKAVVAESSMEKKEVESPVLVAAAAGSEGAAKEVVRREVAMALARTSVVEVACSGWVAATR